MKKKTNTTQNNLVKRKRFYLVSRNHPFSPPAAEQKTFFTPYSPEQKVKLTTECYNVLLLSDL